MEINSLERDSFITAVVGEYNRRCFSPESTIVQAQIRMLRLLMDNAPDEVGRESAWLAKQEYLEERKMQKMVFLAAKIFRYSDSLALQLLSHLRFPGVFEGYRDGYDDLEDKWIGERVNWLKQCLVLSSMLF